MKNKLVSILKKIHHSIPPDIQKLYLFFIDFIRKFQYFKLQVYICKGKEKKSNEPFSIIYIGLDRRICNYWVDRLMSENTIVEDKERVSVRKINKYLEIYKKQYDAAFVEMNNITRMFARRDKGFLIPRWLEMQIDYKEGIKKVQKKDIRRRIRKYSLTFKKDFSKDDIKFFHERMFIPYISKRHGDNAVLCDYRYFRNKFRKRGSRLNFIMSGDRPVAGSFTEFIGKALRLTGVGIIDGREDVLKMGVIGAVYYFELLNANEEGVKTINVGGTSPILTDGLTKFKLSLGAKAADIKFFVDLALWFIPLRDSSALRNCLILNPFIHRVKNDLCRAIFINPLDYNDKSEFTSYMKHIGCDNLKGTEIFCIGDQEKIAEWIKAEGYQNIRLLNYSIQ